MKMRYNRPAMNTPFLKSTAHFLLLPKDQKELHNLNKNISSCAFIVWSMDNNSQWVRLLCPNPVCPLCFRFTILPQMLHVIPYDETSLTLRFANSTSTKGFGLKHERGAEPTRFS